MKMRISNVSATQIDEKSSCAEISAANNEPMIGTAPQVGLWILLEVRETWEAKNLVTNSLPDVANAWLQDSTERGFEAGLLPRVQFIRHRRRKSDPITLMTCRDGLLRKQEIQDYAELADIDPLRSDMPVCDDKLYLVCTHARRDICCSREGLPTWQKLDSLSGGRAWQTTHLGGHRFAPNVLALPSSRSYGRVLVGEAESFFEEVEAGEVPTRFLRGNSTLAPAAQVCEPTILAKNGFFLGVTDDEVTFKTSSGIEIVSIPAKIELDILGSCGDSEMKTVEVYAAAG